MKMTVQAAFQCVPSSLLPIESLSWPRFTVLNDTIGLRNWWRAAYSRFTVLNDRVYRARRPQIWPQNLNFSVNKTGQPLILIA